MTVKIIWTLFLAIVAFFFKRMSKMTLKMSDIGQEEKEPWRSIEFRFFYDAFFLLCMGAIVFIWVLN